jgi:superfamily II DNA or RNA helicase
MFELYPYQKKSVTFVREEWTRVNRTLLVLPTGAGKTVVFSDLTSKLINEESARVLILAHRDELIRQAQSKLEKFTGVGAAIEKASETAEGSFYRVTVGSVQTMRGEKRLARFARSHYTHIIVDEAHHALGDSYLTVLNHFEGAKVLGVTATPDRGDKRDLGKLFESVAFEYPLLQAISEGYLCPIKSLTIPLALDVSNVGIGADGDYDKAQLGAALDPYLPQIAAELWTHCQNKKLLVFLPLRDTARRMSAELCKVGFRSCYVGGDDRSALAAFDAEGVGSACCNAMLLTEGYDNPSIDAVCVLRLTKVRALFCQMVGRGTRLFPGKTHLFLPDFLWNGDRHSLCRPANLIAPSQEIAELMMAKQDAMTEEEMKQGKLFGLTQEEISAAQREVIEQREKALAATLEEMRKKKAKLVDPVQFASSIAAEDLMDYTPTFPADMGPPTDKQVAALEKAGILPDAVTCYGAASMILDKLAVRRMNGMASPKQIRVLERYGVKHAGECSNDDATKAINRLAASGWRKPWENWTDKDGRLIK